ncbi:unnamed protein product [Ambrosiozyma monospora]|uniref:Unnamed protein product n=1 Tax=Ambrosiozyma monospora TaxID=43982 RepID=A0ACB5SU69_AMBMO|nr:unnamed protein product [Ambrosiozyma monospora]
MEDIELGLTESHPPEYGELDPAKATENDDDANDTDTGSDTAPLTVAVADSDSDSDSDTDTGAATASPTVPPIPPQDAVFVKMIETDVSWQ